MTACSLLAFFGMDTALGGGPRHCFQGKMINFVAAGHLLSVTTCPIRNIAIPSISFWDSILMYYSVLEYVVRMD